jgi:glycine betaine/proline transport system substrate-binding protein
VTPRLFAADTLGGVPLGESTIKLGLSPYADELATTALATQMLEKLGYTVKTQQVDVGVWFAGVADGSMDAGFNAWLPVTHGAYWRRYKSKLLDLGIAYKPTKLGWAVPDYVPKKALHSIPDLKNPAVKKHLDGKITGISAGAGEMQLSAKAMKVYGLSKAGYRLQPSSGPVMTASLARAIRRHQWIVVTAWTPHWMWVRFKLRYLKDPKNVLGKKGSVHVITGKNFPKRFPRATTFIKHFQASATGIEKIMNKANKQLDKSSSSKMDEAYAQAAKDYIKAHPELVKKWLQPGQKNAGTKNTGAAS